MAWNPCPPSRGIRAHDPVESVPTITWNTQGLAGSLSKIGSQPLRHAGDYLRLVSLLTATDPETKLRAKTLLQVNRLDADLISAVLELDPIALIPAILRRVKDGPEARRLNQRLAAIRLVCSTATDEALRQSLECQSASKRDPLSACKRDPLMGVGIAVTSAPFAGVGA